MPAEGRENPLLKKGNSDAFFREKYLTKNMENHVWSVIARRMKHNHTSWSRRGGQPSGKDPGKEMQWETV